MAIKKSGILIISLIVAALLLSRFRPGGSGSNPAPQQLLDPAQREKPHARQTPLQHQEKQKPPSSISSTKLPPDKELHDAEMAEIFPNKATSEEGLQLSEKVSAMLGLDISELRSINAKIAEMQQWSQKQESEVAQLLVQNDEKSILYVPPYGRENVDWSPIQQLLESRLSRAQAARLLNSIHYNSHTGYWGTYPRLIEVFHPKAGDWDFVEYTYAKNAQLDLQGAAQKIPEGYHMKLTTNRNKLPAIYAHLFELQQ